MVKTRQLLQRALKDASGNRLPLQDEGDRLDRETQGRWVLASLSSVIRQAPDETTFVVDAVRIKEQIIAIREAYPTSVAHVHLTAPLDVLEKRYKQRPHPKGTIPPPYSKVRENLTELNVDKLRDIADIVINTDRCRPGDVLVRAAARLSM